MKACAGKNINKINKGIIKGKIVLRKLVRGDDPSETVGIFQICFLWYINFPVVAMNFSLECASETAYKVILIIVLIKGMHFYYTD